VLAVLLVAVLVVVLLSCCCCCLHLLYCHVANTATAAATIGTPLPPPPPSAGVKVDSCYTNANSSPATLSQIERRKNQEQKYNMASGSCQTQIKTKQPTKNTQARWGRDET
jgi:hypothetical protein